MPPRLYELMLVSPYPRLYELMLVSPYLNTVLGFVVQRYALCAPGRRRVIRCEIFPFTFFLESLLMPRAFLGL